METEAEEVPLSVNAIHLTSHDQQLFDIVSGKDVTEENPGKYIPASLLIQDIANRGAKSPFNHLKDDISIIADENLLICYDPKSKFGKNYFLCMSEAAKSWALSKMSEKSEFGLRTGTGTGDDPRRHQRPTRPSQQQEGWDEEQQEEAIPDIMYTPPVSKVWESRGSEIEIDEEVLKEARPKFTVFFQKELRFYDPNRQIKLMVRKVDDYKLGYVECAPYEDENFELKRVEIDKFVQCANPTRNLAVETYYRFPTNCWTQTSPRVLSAQELEEEGKSPKLVQFLNSVLQRMLIVLQQNELFDVYFDEWVGVGKVDPSLHGKESSQIKEYQSFSDLKYSKDKMVTCVEWHPTISGIVVVSCATRITYDTRIDKMSKLLMQKYYVLVWSIKDPIHPLLLLQAPDDVQCLAVNPLIPHLVVAGCLNGQIVLWDLSDHMEALRQQKPPTAASHEGVEVKFVETGPEVNSTRFVASSAFEFSHKASVEHIQWVPDHFEIDSKGYANVSKTGYCCQIMSCGLDSCMSIWDIRLDRQPQMDAKMKARDREIMLLVPATFQFLDIVWKPVYVYEVPGLAKTEKLLGVRYSLREAQIHRMPNLPFDLQVVSSMEVSTEVSKAKTRMYVGTIDGKVGTVDFVNDRDVKEADGKMPFRPSSFVTNVHGGPVVSVDRSPFFRNIVLTVGLWRFAIWKEELVGEPLLRLRSAFKRLSSGKWSQVRPAVFFIGKEDGTLEVWDLQEQSHEPVINHTVSAAPLSNISLHPRPQNMKDYMMAAADNLGTLHLLILPLYLLNTTPDEMSSMRAFFDSEVECWKYKRERKEYHQARKEKPVAKPVSMTATAEAAKSITYGRTDMTKAIVYQEEAMAASFKEYLEIEMRYLMAMGLKTGYSDKASHHSDKSAHNENVDS